MSQKQKPRTSRRKKQVEVKKVPLSQTHPVNIIQRILLLEQLRNFPVSLVHGVAPEFTYVFDEEDGTETIEINWEDCLFTFPQEHLFQVVNTCAEKRKKTKPGIMEILKDKDIPLYDPTTALKEGLTKDIFDDPKESKDETKV